MSITVVWVIFGGVCALTETVLPLMVLFFFALGAWAAAAASALGFNLEWQFGFFITVSVLSLLLLRRHAAVFFSGRSKIAEEESAHPLTGQIGIVSREIAPFTVGEINVGGSFWRATSSEPIGIGGQARVLSALPDDALTLHVEGLRPQNNTPKKEQL